MKVYSIYILNKAGGLIYQNDVNPGLNKLSANDYLVLAGTIHGVHAIASKLKSTQVEPLGESSGNEKEVPIESSATFSSSVSVRDSAINSEVVNGRWNNPNTNNTGLRSIETDLFNLYVFQTLTGVKFILITSPSPIVHNVAPLNLKINKGDLNKQFDLAKEIFHDVYVVYSDYVMKDPFYSLEMPIKNLLFDLKMRDLAK